MFRFTSSSPCFSHSCAKGAVAPDAASPQPASGPDVALACWKIPVPLGSSRWDPGTMALQLKSVLLLEKPRCARKQGCNFLEKDWQPAEGCSWRTQLVLFFFSWNRSALFGHLSRAGRLLSSSAVLAVCCQSQSRTAWAPSEFLRHVPSLVWRFSSRLVHVLGLLPLSPG